MIKQNDEVRKISIGQGDDYTAGCLLDFTCFEKNYRVIAADSSNKKDSDAGSRAIHQIVFNGKINNSSKYKSNNLLHSWTTKRNKAKII